MDISHYFSGDIGLSNTGDLAMVDGITESQQRIIRMILTNPGDYEFHPTYGIGAGGYVGATVADLDALCALISSQITQDPSVAPFPLPEVTAKSSDTTLYVNIKYVDATTNTTQVLAFNTGGM